MSLQFSVPVAFAPSSKDLANIWTPYGPPSRQILPKRWTKDEGRKSLPVDMIWEKDVRVPLRDGVHLLADVFRPVSSDQTPVPAIMPWSPYGKTGTGTQTLDMLPFRVGVPRAATSGLEKWEAPDPAEWIQRGYALVHIDARGTFMSEGDFAFYGTQEGRDGYDSIEWIAAQPWSNGAVSMAGNSWLGTTQWFIAAEKPPHLRCMAPWEGLGDFYRESIGRGGIPDHAFWDALTGFFGGQHKREDVAAMIDDYPLYNDYWDDKKPKLRNIEVPMYATASYSTGLHTEGSVKGFLLSSSREKWLRWTTTQEWHDIYQQENVDDLQRFFDHYMLNVDNGWEKTPTVRLSLLGYNRPHVINRPAASYPPPEFVYRKFYLDASKSALEHSLLNSRSSQEYNAAVHRTEVDVGARFDLTFDRYTELCGFSRLKLFMATPDHDDMDVYAVLRKVDRQGNVLYNYNIPLKDLPADLDPKDYPHMNTFKHTGPNGRLRASHRAVTPERVPGMSETDYAKIMSEAYVWHEHDEERKLQKNEIYQLDFHLWPGGMVFDAGETLRLEVKGSSPIVEEFIGLGENIVNHNVGAHVLYTGADCPSYLYVALSD